MSAVFAALWLPASPNAAISLAAGQILSALNFFFLSRLVKLFTGATRIEGRGAVESMRAKGLLLSGAKLAVVYGGAFAVTRWRGVDYLPLMLGLSMPLLAIFLKSIMLALPAGAAKLSRRATSTASPARSQAKLAATVLLVGALALPLALLGPGRAFANDPPAAAGATVAEAGHGEAAHAEAGKDEGGATHLPNWITIANDYAPNNPIVHWMHENEYLVFAWLAPAKSVGATPRKRTTTKPPRPPR